MGWDHDPVSCILDILREPLPPESELASTQPEDSDSWLSMHPEQLDALLQKTAGSSEPEGGVRQVDAAGHAGAAHSRPSLLVDMGRVTNLFVDFVTRPSDIGGATFEGYALVPDYLRWHHHRRE
jgi:hypothetical protein